MIGLQLGISLIPVASSPAPVTGITSDCFRLPIVISGAFLTRNASLSGRSSLADRPLCRSGTMPGNYGIRVETRVAPQVVQ